VLDTLQLLLVIRLRDTAALRLVGTSFLLMNVDTTVEQWDGLSSYD
jgi:hypothetical protein